MSDTLRGKVNSLTKSTDVNIKLANKCRNLQENVGSDFVLPAMIHSTKNLHKFCILYRVFIQSNNYDVIKTGVYISIDLLVLMFHFVFQYV